MYSKRSNDNFCVFPGYRWCGPGCRGPGWPTNDVDACCMKHDRCLSSCKSRCHCDKQFLRCLRPKINAKTRKGKEAALMYGYMKLQTRFTCSCKNGK